MARNPRIKVTAFEAAHHLRYTADTLALVRARNPGVDFVWVMGADNLRDFHRWQRWRQIVMTFPIAVIDRPGATLSFLSSVVAKTFDYARIDEADAPRLCAYEGAGLDLHPRPALARCRPAPSARDGSRPPRTSPLEVGEP